MNPAATSDLPSGQILSVRDLSLSFRLRYYEQRTMRGVFVEMARNPLGALLKSKDRLHVLHNVSFSLKKGDRLAVMGVNGSGKTSLCRCIASMLHPDSGQVRIAGSCRAVFDAGVGVIPELTGRENASLLASLLYPGDSPDALQALVDEATRFSELDHFLDVPYETYSLGMKARLFLSVVTAKPADLLILDEVYDNTDRFFQKKMTERLMNFIQSAKAVIFVTHSADVMRQVCNRALILHQSRVAFDGDIQDAIAAYDSLQGRSLSGGTGA
ncbi:MAG: ATP-binding cassette domain-containing protein [Oligoflexia bacterium]|nr:ATP-binding cassette domain-containing protein [Oligoflexia bacterium]